MCDQLCGSLRGMARTSLTEIKRRYVLNGRPLDTATEAALREDPRAGAKAILQAIGRRRFENRAEGQRLRHLLRYEWALWDRGVVQVAGVDEAGMSPLAGPVVAGAVVFPRGARIPGVDDSKKLCVAERERLASEIKRAAAAWAVGFAEVAEIDTINIYWASQLAMKRAVAGLSVRPDHVLIDGRRVKDLEVSQQPIIGGDAKSLTIAAASILAKTARDALMRKLDAAHPGYGFAKHKGYGVPQHLKALRALGACPLHRTSFGPVRDILGLPPLPPWPGSREAQREAANSCAKQEGHSSRARGFSSTDIAGRRKSC
jgi:ribonuclease HII